ncbi:MAG: nucleotidyltransferase domain-containing protein [Burkholderiaceae bacterium]|nr:nucleotidyltransferase domain-containing protein [Burkholderiaceae bacterium]
MATDKTILSIMRISQELLKNSVDIISSHYGDGVKIWLFGSRVNDKQRGGDVDIFIENASKDALQRIRCQSQLVELFDLKVDLIVGTGDQPIHQIAKTTGIRIQ